jgi:hypothetical protein
MENIHMYPILLVDRSPHYDLYIYIYTLHI